MQVIVQMLLKSSQDNTTISLLNSLTKLTHNTQAENFTPIMQNIKTLIAAFLMETNSTLTAQSMLNLLINISSGVEDEGIDFVT